MSAIAFCRAFLKYISVEENRNKRRDDVEWNKLIDLFWSTPTPLSLALAGGRGHHGRGRPESPDDSDEWIPPPPAISGTRSTLTSSWRTVISTGTQTETTELNSTSTNMDNPDEIDDSRCWDSDSDDSSEENSLSFESRSVPVVLPCRSHSHLMPPPPGTGRRGRRIHFGRSLALMHRPQPVILPPPMGFADQNRCRPRHHEQLYDILNQVTAMEEKVAEFEAYFLC